MAKLYPPNIEGTIPAFTGTTLVVPFSMNLAVGKNEVKAIFLKVKKVNTNDVLLTKETTLFQISSECKAYFYFTEEEWKPNMGQYYRIQIAYKDHSDQIGYYSTVGVTKYTSVPSIVLLDMATDAANLHKYVYTAVYSQAGIGYDATEKLYSTHFKLVDSQNNVVYDSGEVIHSVINDILPYQATEKFEINQDLKINETHRVILQATTVNGVIITSPKYRVIQRENANLMFEDIRYISKVNAISDFDEGRTIITLKLKEDADDYRLSGTFVISRSEVGAIHNWRKLKKFFIRSENIEDFVYTDYTVEQGKTYVYSLQQYNNYDIYSNRIISNEIYVDFEDMFLLDGERQLKIRFNPKVANFKAHLLENKADTIGSPYPFITRNGRVNYKEFSVSGLISMLSDNNESFMSGIRDLEIYTASREQTPSSKIFNTVETNLTSDNIEKERRFKLEVLQWLNDGKPKIFKSPAEGNYIVRLMNISLTPIDTLSRMLHSFNSTAYEIAAFSYESLEKYKFIDTSNVNNIIYKWKTIQCAERDETTNQIVYKHGELLSAGEVVYTIKAIDMMPGSFIYVNGQKIVIGATGSYYAVMSSPVNSIIIPEDHNLTGSIEVSYKDVYYTQFDKIRRISLKEIPVLQLIGNAYWKYKSEDDDLTQINIIESLRDIKTEILDIPKVRFTKRAIHKIYTPYNKGKIPTVNSNFYSVPNSIDSKYKITLSELNKMELYEVYYSSYGAEQITDEKGVITYHKDGKIYTLDELDLLYDAVNSPDKLIPNLFNLYEININHSLINLEASEEYTAKGIDFYYISIGDGIVAEVTLSEQIIDYSYEFDHPEVKGLRKQYDELLERYLAGITNPLGYPTEDSDLAKLKSTYSALITRLTQALVEDYTIGG